MNRPLRMLSLCSGIGGIDLAACWAGFEIAGQVEIDPFCRAVLAKHWPDVPRMNDIREVQGHEFGAIDIVAAGIPCQGNSLAGKRRGSQDERNLWPEAKRIIGRAQPRWVLVENVYGLLTVDDRRLFGGILSDLVALGYRVGWAVYGAGDVGAPHQRERVFIVAHLPGIGSDAWRPEPTGQQWAPNADLYGTEDLAYSNSTRWAPIRDGLSTRQNDTTLSSSASHVADPSSARGGLWQRSDREAGTQAGSRSTVVAHSQSTECQWSGDTRRRWDGFADGGTELAHTTEQGLSVRGYAGLTQDAAQPGAGMESQPERCSQLANPDRQGLAVGDRGAATRGSRATVAGSDAGPVESRLGRDASRFPSWLDQHRWPALPGQPQEEWEPSRTVPKQSPGKQPLRNHRLKALGNSVVPQQIYPILQAIADSEYGCEEVAL